jgi:hypothetical protein
MNYLVKYTGLVRDNDNSPCTLGMWLMEPFSLLDGNSYFLEVYCSLRLQGRNRLGYL